MINVVGIFSLLRIAGLVYDAFKEENNQGKKMGVATERKIYLDDQKCIWLQGDFIDGKGIGKIELKKFIPGESGQIMEHGYSTSSYSIPDKTIIEGSYEGEWLSDKFHGFGRFKGNPTYIFNDAITKSTNFVYEGNFFHGKAHGLGKIFLGEELVFEGTFEEGSLHGNGGIYHSGVIVYKGQFADNLFHGKGTLYRKGKIFFSGEIDKNIPNGKGISYGRKTNSGLFKKGYFYLNKEIYKLRLPKPFGFIVDTYPDVHLFNSEILVYKGGLKNTFRHGKGIEYDEFTNGGGEVIAYEGDFYEDLYHGFGKTSTYEGEFKEGKKHGYGIEDFGTSRYEGSFANGQRHGEGRLYTIKNKKIIDSQTVRYDNGKRINFVGGRYFV